VVRRPAPRRSSRARCCASRCPDARRSP
jgi:hypothetical protein